ncbi:MAG: glycoside hydrolase family 3 protein [Candidatus Kapaibacterium sp.]
MKRIDKWSSHELAAQVVVGRISGAEYFSNDEIRSKAKKLAEAGAGAFCVFHGSTGDTARMIEELTIASPIAPIFMADFEHGLPMRLAGGTEFPHAMAMGRSGNFEMIRKVGGAIAQEAKAIGINWVLGPVCDINSNESNPIINIRSFGEDAELVARCAEEYIYGLQEEKVLACAKHFPGHGDCALDSHIDLPLLKHSREHIDKVETLPFRRAIASDVKSIMPGHLAAASIDESGLPASLSPEIINNYLRKNLGYSGLVITDGLDMHSITRRFAPGEAAVMAIRAGCDIALLPADPFEAIESIANEADRDMEFRKKIENSVKKIIDTKRWCEVIPGYSSLDHQKIIYSAKHEQIALKIAHDAVDVTGDKSLLPLNKFKNFAGFAFVQSEDDLDSGARFFKMLAQAVQTESDFGFIDETISDEQIESFNEQIDTAEAVVIAFFYRARAFKGSVDIPERLAEIVKKIKPGLPTIAVLLGNPYLKDKIPARLHIRAFSDSLPSIAATILTLSGREFQPQADELSKN